MTEGMLWGLEFTGETGACLQGESLAQVLGSEKREQEQVEYQIQMEGESLTKYLEI